VSSSKVTIEVFAFLCSGKILLFDEKIYTFLQKGRDHGGGVGSGLRHDRREQDHIL